MNAYANASVRACVRCVCSADEEPHHTRDATADARARVQKRRASSRRRTSCRDNGRSTPVSSMLVYNTPELDDVHASASDRFAILPYVPNSLYPPLACRPTVYTVVFTRAVCSCRTAALTAAALRHALPTASQPTPCSLQPSKPSAAHRY